MLTFLPCALKHGYGREPSADPMNRRMIERGCKPSNVRHLVLDEADRTARSCTLDMDFEPRRGRATCDYRQSGAGGYMYSGLADDRPASEVSTTKVVVTPTAAVVITGGKRRARSSTGPAFSASPTSK